MNATANIDSRVERTIAAILVELWPLLSMVLLLEGMVVAVPVGFDGMVMLDGAAGGSARLVSVTDGDGVPTIGGNVGVEIVVN